VASYKKRSLSRTAKTCAKPPGAGVGNIGCVVQGYVVLRGYYQQAHGDVCNGTSDWKPLLLPERRTRGRCNECAWTERLLYQNHDIMAAVAGVGMACDRARQPHRT
jgi:hypothetical protein